MNDGAGAAARRETGIGVSLPRLEDERLLTGRGRFIDDINLPRQLHAWFVRASHAHADIRSIDTTGALAAPGVVAVLTGSDLAADGMGDLPCEAQLKGRDGTAMRAPMRSAMPTGRVRHVGDTVAMVLAETAAAARDAADRVIVDYAERPAVTDARAALADGAAQIWDDIPGNLALHWAGGDAAATDAAFARAAHVTRLQLVNNRVVVAAAEPRGAVAEYDAGTGRYTLYTPTQGGTVVQMALAQHGLRVPATDIRLVTPDVGGGFGMKNYLYPEQVLVPWAARRLGRPVKWYPDRGDAFVTDAHARDHWMDAELALDAEGKFLGIRVSTISNMGAYMTSSAPIIPTEGGTRMLTNVYRMPAASAETRLVLTNTVPIAAYRGAGKPEFAYMVERLVDQAAREMKIDPADLRRRNMITPTELPYRTAMGLVYDSGDFATTLDRAMMVADRDGFASRRKAAHARGRLRGLGFCVFTEPDGYKDGRVSMQFDPTGRITVTLTAASNGQGYNTTFGQIVVDRLGMPLDMISIVQGDTDRVGHGSGGGGSRVTTVAGTAIWQASEKIVERGRRIAAQMMEASPEDVEFADGTFTISGTDRSVDIVEVARASFNGGKVPPGEGLGLEASAHYNAPVYSYPCGCHVAEVEIDTDTGATQLVGYVMVSDYGTVINPALLKGQVIGGVVQGIGQALTEDCVYDPASGQLLSGSFMDYCLPRASHLPDFGWDLIETPCTTNPLGVKGCGESGSTAALPAVMNAVMDAVATVGVNNIDMPATPERVWRALRDAGAA